MIKRRWMIQSKLPNRIRIIIEGYDDSELFYLGRSPKLDLAYRRGELTKDEYVGEARARGRAIKRNVETIRRENAKS